MERAIVLLCLSLRTIALSIIYILSLTVYLCRIEFETDFIHAILSILWPVTAYGRRRWSSLSAAAPHFVPRCQQSALSGRPNLRFGPDYLTSLKVVGSLFDKILKK